MRKLIAGIFFLLLIIPQTGFANDPPTDFAIPKLNGKITLDGKIEESAWFAIDPLPLTLHWPSFATPMTEKTEIRIAYDDQYIYVGAICHDRDPAKIYDPTFQRDDWGLEMDQLALILDPYHDKENSLAFVVTPSGSRVDAVVKNDAQGDDAVNVSWNSYWIANATYNEHGWQAEIQIPFSSLRFQERDGKIQMGMSAYRYIARKKEMQTFPAIRPDWGFWSFVKASQTQTVTFDGIQNKRPWYTSPYVVLGTGFHYEDNGAESPDKINDDKLQLGLDVQHAFSDNLNADFTINTDFAQVEADDQMVNLSRFSLFFPEKRRFFLERSSTFDFKYDLNNNLFYSRRIGIKDGELIPMYGGVRLVGRLKKWDVGFLNMQSQAKGDFTSENFGVIRLRRNVFNPRSYLGGMLTTRLDADGHRNVAYGVDGIINLFQQNYLQVNIAQSQDTDDPEEARAIDKARIYLMWENRIINGLGYRFSYSKVGSDYNPGLGFERRFNFTQLGDQVFYSWFAPEESSLRQTTVTLAGNISFNNTTQKLETRTLGLNSMWEWNRGSIFSVGVENFQDKVPGTFDLSDDITIEPGTYTNTSGLLSYQTPPVSFIRMQTNAQYGSFYGGNLLSVGLIPTVVLSKYLQLSAFYQYSLIDFKDQDQKFRSHLVRLNVNTSVNVKLSMSAFVQHNSLNDLSSLNFRLRFNPVDGNDLYIVYNEILNSQSELAGKMLPFSDSRAILLKYIHTFRL